MSIISYHDYASKEIHQLLYPEKDSVTALFQQVNLSTLVLTYKILNMCFGMLKDRKRLFTVILWKGLFESSEPNASLMLSTLSSKHIEQVCTPWILSNVKTSASADK